MRLIKNAKAEAEHEQAPKKIRDSNIELLRIVSIFCIILYHLNIHSGIGNMSLEGVNGAFKEWTTHLGKFGNYNFMLISGYFLCKKSFSPRQVFKILFQVWFFSMLTVYILVCAGAPFEYIRLSGLLTPILKVNNWYPVAYLLVYLLSDALNAALAALSGKKMLILLAGSLLFQFDFVIFDLRFTDVARQVEVYESTVVLFCTLYMVGGWIRLHGIKPSFLKKPAVPLIISAAAYIGNIFAGNTKSILIFISSLFCFIGFLSMDIGSKRPINFIAACSFGVYLFHENSEVRELVWTEVFGIKSRTAEPYFIPYCIGAALAVYLVSIIADLIRQRYFSAPLWKLIDNRLIPFLRKKRIIKEETAAQTNDQ